MSSFGHRSSLHLISSTYSRFTVFSTYSSMSIRVSSSIPLASYSVLRLLSILAYFHFTDTFSTFLLQWTNVMDKVFDKNKTCLYIGGQVLYLVNA